MTPRIPCLRPLAALFGVLLFGFALYGQTETATISGTITDPSGAAIIGAEVTLTNVATGNIASTQSNKTGLYVFPAVRPGQYRLTVDRAGFKQVVLTQLTVNVQDTLSRNFTLQLGAVGESVTVSGEIATLNTESATVGTLVNDQFVQNIPLNGRSFQSLIYATPGVVIMPAGINEPGTFSTNGQRTNANYFTIDGVSANVGATTNNSLGQTAFGTTPSLTSGGGTNGMVSVDSMQEFRIQTSSYSPEFGRQPGAQIAIATKSGTNQWHGTAFDYIRNNWFDARNYFNTLDQPMPALRQNDFGGTVGGPIWKNHTFFFFSYEGLRLLEPYTNEGYFLMPSEIAQIPDSSAWKPLLAGTPQPSPNAPLLDPNCGANGPNGGYSSNPTDPTYNPCQGQIFANQSNPSNFNAYALRIDQAIGKNLMLFGRYDHTPSNQGLYLFNEQQQSQSNIDTMTVGLTWTISPTMVNDLRGNWSRTTGHQGTVNFPLYGATVLPESLLFPPGLNASNAQAVYGFLWGEVRAGAWATNPITQWNIVDSFSKSFGGHQVKFGVDWRRMQPSTTPDTGPYDAAINGFYELYYGTVDTWLNTASIPITAHMNNLSFFGQDTWKLNRKWTLTYGLRWDINTPPVSNSSGHPLYAVNGIFNSGALELVNKPLWSTQYSAFAPRIGVAYQVTPSAVLRGGFGMFYDLGYGGAVSGVMGGSFPYSGQVFGSDVTGMTPLSHDLFQPPPFSTVPDANTLYMSAVDPHLRLPVTYQWNGAIELGLGRNQTFTATYVGAAGEKLLYDGRVTPLDSVFVDSGGYVATTLNQGRSHYNAMQLQFMRRMTRGFQAMLNYTLGYSNDTGSSDMSGYYAPSVQQIPISPMTRSNFDIRNNFQAMLSYNIPGANFGGKIGRIITQGWGLDGVYRIESGPPLNVIMQTQGANGTYISVQPDLVPGQPIWIADPTQPVGDRLNPAAFNLPSGTASGVTQFGTLPRNGIQSPYGIDQVDLAVRRTFNITERVKLNLRMDYFNLLNHPMFGGSQGPGTAWGVCFSNPCANPVTKEAMPGNLVNYTFGYVLPGYTLNYGLGGGGYTQGQNALYAPGGPRSGQISLKLLF